MKILKLLKQLFISLYFSIKRFPISIACATSATIIFIILFNNQQDISNNTREVLTRIGMILVLGVPISLCIKLFFEKKEVARIKTISLIYLIGAIGLLFYYLFLLKEFEMVSITRYIAVNTAFYLSFLFIPYFYKKNDFELYVIKLLTRFFVTAFYSLILFGGISAILFTINKLLGVEIQGKIYIDIWMAIVGVFAVCFFLAGIPSYSHGFDSSDYSKLLKVLLLYIVIPLIIAYTIILYIYFAKVIITFKWPMGMVGNLVLWYGVICVVVFFFISPLCDSTNWVRRFIFWLSKIIIPLIIMMFVSIGIRVKAYGITENRYYVIVLGLWVLGIMIYQTFVKSRRNIILPISLSVIAILSVFGPWSSYAVSENSQNSRFEHLLIKNYMLINNRIVKPSKTVSDEDEMEISQILGYFSNSHKLSDVKYLPPNFNINKMEDVFGFPNNYSRYGNQGVKYFNYNLAVKNMPISIEGYDYLFNINNYEPTANQSDNVPQVNYKSESSELSVILKGKEVYKNLVLSFVKQIYKKHGAINNSDLALKELTFVDENDRVKIKLIIQNVGGQEDKSTGGVLVNSINFYVLLKIK
jgi:hypothetical protein